MNYDPYTYWENRAQSWVNETFDTKRDWSLIQEFVPSYTKVLELGCGTGRWADYFTVYEGVDISHRLIAHCNLKYHDNPKKQFKVWDVRAGIPDTDADLIFASQCFLHVPYEDIKRIKLPKDKNYLFIEPWGPSGVEYCFQHDLKELFGMKILCDYGKSRIYGRFI